MSSTSLPFATFEEPNKLYVGPDKELVILTDEEVQVLLTQVCISLQKHAWNKDKDPWRCTRCKKTRRPRKSLRQRGGRQVANIADVLNLIL